MIILLSVLLLAAASLTYASERNALLDKGWKFCYGANDGAESVDFDDSAWRTLDLPHDWSVETEAAEALGNNVGPFSKDAIGKHQTGFTVGGEGWYRREFQLTPEDLDGRVAFYFEGVYNQADVWVNGHKAYFNPYGYQGFKFDVTDLCQPGRNTVAVKVRNIGNNTRWYAGSGIYRHVWLERTPKTYLDAWHAQITTKGNKVTLKCDPQGADPAVPVKVSIFDPDGKEVCEGTPGTFEVTDARLWSPDEPCLYTAVFTTAADTIEVPFGIRDIEFSAEDGMLLNGKPLLLRGGCVHHDHGLLGAASHDGAEARKVALLKAQGYNALRCSHNLQSEAFMRECDRQGVVLIDECFDQWRKPQGKNADDYHIYFDQYSRQDIRTMVLRDRNHPSVVFWSIGNEIPERAEADGIATSHLLRCYIRELDSTRPITASIATWGNGPNNWERDVQPAFGALDVGGYNYNYQKYKSDHAEYPDRVMMGTESYPMDIARNWQLVESEPYVIGDFIWTAMDYLGEAGIGHVVSENNTMFMPWPWFNGWCGDIDLIGQKKPQSYFHDVVWRRSPIAMAVAPPNRRTLVSGWGWKDECQSWTFPECEGDTAAMTVNVYARSPFVRLYLNGALVGEQPVSDVYEASFQLPYVPGTLTAVEWDGAAEGAGVSLVTTGKPADVRFSSQQWGDLMFVTAELVDSEGRVVIRGGDHLTAAFPEEEGYTLIAAGNASPTDMESFRCAAPKFFQGRALAIYKSNN